MAEKLDHCYQGDCRDVMRTLIAEGVRVQCIVTSPPYWGLRDYGVDGQLGLEASLPEFIAGWWMSSTFAGSCWPTTARCG